MILQVTAQLASLVSQCPNVVLSDLMPPPDLVQWPRLHYTSRKSHPLGFDDGTGVIHTRMVSIRAPYSEQFRQRMKLITSSLDGVSTVDVYEEGAVVR